MRRAGRRSFSGIAFWTALVFLVHPIGSEAVTYVSGRPTLLATFFGLAALWLAVGPAWRHQSGRRAVVARPDPWRAATTAAIVCCLALALLSKETAIVFPALLLIWHFAFGRAASAPESRVGRRHHLAMWSTVAVFLSVAALHARYAFLFRFSLGLRGWSENLLSQACAVAYGATLLAAPAPSRLNFDHDLPLVTSFWQWPAPLCVASIAVLATLAIIFVRRAPLFSFGLLWFFVSLAPTNSILPRYDLLSERNLYLPSIGFFVALVDRLAAGGARLATWLPAAHARSRLALRLAAGAIVLLLAGITIERNRLYADPVAFWADAARKSPRKARPHTNYGYALYQAGQTDRAVDEFRAALAIDPDDPDAQRNLRRAWTAGRHSP